MSSALRASLACAGAVCACGFGVMLSLWYALREDATILGFWDYLSGTAGDAVVLPVLVGSLVYGCVALPPGARDRVLGSAGAVLGGIGGAVVQYSWIADPHPRLNWVLPRPGRFSVPGWYHAAFLVVVSAAVCATYFVVLGRLAGTADACVARRIRWPTALFAGAVPAFLGLVVIDSAPSVSTASSTTTIALCAGAVIAAAAPFSLAARRVARVLIPAQAAGVLAGVAFVGIVIVCMV